jgi:nucleoside-diphosphate-sugar epimerase
MKILVTGAAGYVGTQLTKRLLQDGHCIVGVDTFWFGDYLPAHANLQKVKADIRQTELVPMKGMDAVIHLANIANDPTGDLNSKLTWEVNALASKFLIEKAIDAGVKHFIFASSGSVYGVKDEPEVTEELSLVPITDYNKTKMVSERVLLSYNHQIPLTIVRPATICGYSPRMRLDLAVNMLFMQGISKKRITVFGGDQTRPNIHMDDMIEVYCHALRKPESMRGIFNAGFENISILEIAELVRARTQAEVIVSESNDPRSYRLNSDKLLATGFTPKKKVCDALDELGRLYEKGELKDLEDYYNLKVMKRLNVT